MKARAAVAWEAGKPLEIVEVDLEDLFWIEWLKIKHTGVYNDLKCINIKSLKTPLEVITRQDKTEGIVYQIEKIIGSNKQLESILNHLFVNELNKKVFTARLL